MRQSSQCIGCEGGPLIGADTTGQVELVKQAGADGFGLMHSGRGDDLTGQQETAVAILEIAINPRIAGFTAGMIELAELYDRQTVTKVTINWVFWSMGDV